MGTSCSLNANGLELIEIHTYSEPVIDIDDEKLHTRLCENFVGKSYVVVWLDYKVLIGTYENQKFTFYKDESFELKHVQRLRVFNQQKEFFLWRTNGQWKGRLRQDEEGDKVEVVVAKQLLFGTKSTRPRLNEGFTEIYENRGTKLILPFTDLNLDDKAENNRIFLQTHNYIKTNSIHQVTYFDCRFVAFMNGTTVLV